MTRLLPPTIATWQSMEIAPKDGSHILGVIDPGVVVCMKWADDLLLWRNTTYLLHVYRPVMWAPLPELSGAA